MSTIAEFYSRNLATESIKGMTQKAKQGGTSTRAPIGYLNVGVRDKVGREVRTVIVDPERGHLVAWAFKAYASGNWTLSQLRRELTEQGLTTVPTPARPAKPISESGIHRVLTNPYYKGTVTFRGSTYRGNHEALIPPEVFYQVQAVLAAHTSRGDRTQVHDHYLKGLVYCGMCGSRMILTHAKSHTGSIYPYFICGGRHAKTTDCRMQATSVTKVEELIAEHYHTVELDARQQAATRQMVNAEYDALMAEAGKDLQALTARKQAIQAEQDRLLDAHLAGKVPLGVLGRKQDALQVELDTVTTDIAACKVDYAVQRTAVDDALALAIDPAAICHRAGPTVKRLLNDAFLRRVNLHQRPRDPHGTQERVAVEFELATPYDELLSAATIHRAEQWATTHTLTPQDALPTPGSPAAGLNIVHKGCSVAALPPTLPRSHGRVRRPAAFSPFRTHSVRVLAYGVSEPRPQAQGGAFEHVGYGV
jgi:hypothetical protein